MSGIAGIIHLKGGDACPSLLAQMTAQMGHRGPDGIDHWHKGPIALGQCMLRTTPESLNANLPLVSEDNQRILIMDGRVDNWEELRSQLLGLGIRLRTNADEELVLKAYEQWGETCLTHIDGDFSIALWDAQRRTLLCARDRVGQKPFYYHRSENYLAFASEMRPLLDLPWVRQEVNEGIIAEVISGRYYSLEETHWQGILRLPPAHKMTFDGADLKIARYWSPDFDEAIRYKTREEYAEHYKDLLFDVIRRYSRSHKPLACEVSGGLDSSAIYAIAIQLERKGAQTAPTINGYTLLFDDDSDANELKYARAVGAHVQRLVHEVAPTYRSLTWHRDFTKQHKTLALAPNGLMHGGIQKAAAASGAVVLLRGIGGDEWLSGVVDTYADHFSSHNWSGAARDFGVDVRENGWRNTARIVARRGVFPLLPESVKSRARAIRDALNPSTRINHRPISPGLAGKLAEQLGKRQQDPSFYWGTRGHKEQSAYLSDAFNVTARESMEHFSALDGLEQRLPLFSLPMIRFCLATPAHYRKHQGTDRALHRTAMNGILPELVRTRQTKAEFSVAYQTYLPQLEAAEEWKSVLGPRDWVDMRMVTDPSGQDASAGRGWHNIFWPWALFSCALAAQDRSCPDCSNRDKITTGYSNEV